MACTEECEKNSRKYRLNREQGERKSVGVNKFSWKLNIRVSDRNTVIQCLNKCREIRSEMAHTDFLEPQHTLTWGEERTWKTLEPVDEGCKVGPKSSSSCPASTTRNARTEYLNIYWNMWFLHHNRRMKPQLWGQFTILESLFLQEAFLYIVHLRNLILELFRSLESPLTIFLYTLEIRTLIMANKNISKSEILS